MVHFYEKVFGYLFVHVVMRPSIHGLKWCGKIYLSLKQDCGLTGTMLSENNRVITSSSWSNQPFKHPHVTHSQPIEIVKLTGVFMNPSLIQTCIVLLHKCGIYNTGQADCLSLHSAQCTIENTKIPAYHWHISYGEVLWFTVNTLSYFLKRQQQILVLIMKTSVVFP